MKRLFAIVFLCGFLIPCAYGETITYSNGKYVGDVVNGVPNGYGTFTLAKGDKYVGEWKNGKYYGQGTLTFPNGDKYVGEFKDDEFQGQGTYTYQHGETYVGEFKDSKYHGQGTGTLPDGSKYVGEWKNGNPLNGIHYFASGNVQGTFSNGNWCESCKPTKEQLALVASIGKSSSGTGQADSAEIVFWQSIQDSDNPDMFRAYLKKYPDGEFAFIAELKIKELSSDAPTVPDLNYGDYYALVIGNNRYDHLSDLRTAVNDARSVATLLELDYGFNVTKLENANREQIIDSISGLRSKVTSEDNVLI